MRKGTFFAFALMTCVVVRANAQSTPKAPNASVDSAAVTLATPQKPAAEVVTCEALMQMAQSKVLSDDEKASLVKCVDQSHPFGGQNSVVRKGPADILHGPGPNNDIFGRGPFRCIFGC